MYCCRQVSLSCSWKIFCFLPLVALVQLFRSSQLSKALSSTTHLIVEGWGQWSSRIVCLFLVNWFFFEIHILTGFIFFRPIFHHSILFASNLSKAAKLRFNCSVRLPAPDQAAPTAGTPGVLSDKVADLWKQPHSRVLQASCDSGDYCLHPPVPDICHFFSTNIRYAPSP